MTAPRAGVAVRPGRTGRGSYRRHAQILAYISFRHAQGNQPLQVHYIESYVRILRALGVTPAAGDRDALAEHIRRLRLPLGHMEIPDATLVDVQFAFWWANIWDITLAVFTGDHRHLPTRARLDERVTELGGTTDMSSFTDVELTDLAAAFDRHRSASATALGPVEVVERYVVPALIEVEFGFQGSGDRYPTRPRTDGGDIHESRMAEHCLRALRRYREGRPDPTDRIYRAICHRLDQLSLPTFVPDPTAGRYRDLVGAYNHTHPADPVVRLHVPDEFFPAVQHGGEVA
jgi:hypothetical protein